MQSKHVTRLGGVLYAKHAVSVHKDEQKIHATKAQAMLLIVCHVLLINLLLEIALKATHPTAWYAGYLEAEAPQCGWAAQVKAVSNAGGVCQEAIAPGHHQPYSALQH